jgi:HEAT repeat protein
VLPLILTTCLSVTTFAPMDDVVIKRLVESLKDTDPEIRSYLATAIAKYGVAAVEPLSAALKDAKPERRAGAAYTLAQLGPVAKSAMPILLDLLDDTDVNVRRQVAFAISRIATPTVTSGGPR